MSNQNNINFEEALSGLEKSAEDLKKEGTTLEAALKSYQQGIEYYNTCVEILNDAKQKIEFYNSKETI